MGGADGLDGGKDWTWYATLALGSADLIQGLLQRGRDLIQGPTLYAAQYARPWVGRTDAEQEEDWDSNKKILTRAPLPSSATDVFLPLEYF